MQPYADPAAVPNRAREAPRWGVREARVRSAIISYRILNLGSKRKLPDAYRWLLFMPETRRNHPPSRANYRKETISWRKTYAN